MTRAVIIAALLLSGCVATGDIVPPSTPMPAGHATSTPPQWIDYCIRNPSDPAC